mmetsp:Transcript_157660/g.278270  ORF Transcript_157660/g.278270 Transcript_157660/m.278270 type:complete len:173 (-) Transcript_157660:397-915(-)
MLITDLSHLMLTQVLIQASSPCQSNYPAPRWKLLLRAFCQSNERRLCSQTCLGSGPSVKDGNAASVLCERFLHSECDAMAEMQLLAVTDHKSLGSVQNLMGGLWHPKAPTMASSWGQEMFLLMTLIAESSGWLVYLVYLASLAYLASSRAGCPGCPAWHDACESGPQRKQPF